MQPGLVRRACVIAALSALVVATVISVGAEAGVAAAGPVSGVVAIEGGELASLVVSPAGVVFASNPTKNELEVLDLATGGLEAPIPVGSDPQGLELSPDGSTLYVADMGSGQVSVVDVASRREVRRITIPGALLNVTVAEPVSVALANNGKLIVSTAIGDGGGSLVEVDPASGSVSLLSYLGPTAELAPSADGSHIGVLTGGVSPSSVYLYTSATDSLSAETYIGPYVEGIALNSTGSQLLSGQYLLDDGMNLDGTIPAAGAAGGRGEMFAASGPTAYAVVGQQVDVIDTARQLETASVALPEPVGNATGAIAVSPDGATLVVATQSGFSVIPLAAAQPVPSCTPTVTGTVPGPIVAHVCGGPLGNVVADDAGHVFASNPSLNEIEVLDVATGQLEPPIDVGSDPEGLALSADGSMLYVADDGSEQISVVDVAQRAETKRIDVIPNSFEDPTVASVAVADNGEALVSSTFPLWGATPAIYEVNLQSDVVRTRTDFYQSELGTPGAALVASGDHSQVGVEESPFNVFVYNAATDSFGPMVGLDNGGGDISLDGTGAQLLVNPSTSVPDPVTYALGEGSNGLNQLGTIPGGGLGIAFSADSATAYRVQQDYVDVIDVATKWVTGAIALPEPVGDAAGTVVLSPDGNALAVLTQSGISVAPVNPSPQASPTLTATVSASSGPLGTAFSDTATLSGSEGATGTITFSLWGSGSTPAGICVGTPAFVSTKAVNGDGTFQSDQVRPNLNGYYYWVAEYSGDLANKVAGPTTCGGPASTIDNGIPHMELTEATSVSSGTFPLTVKYSYRVRNDGQEPLVNVSVNDTACAPAVFASGTGGPSGILETGETWTFTCARTFTQPGTFVGSATAAASDDLDQLPAPGASATSTVQVTCGHLVTGAVRHEVIAGPGSTCIEGAQIVGNVAVPPGTALYVSDSAVAGLVEAIESTDFTLCGSYIAGSVVVESGTGPTSVGNSSINPECAGNTITSLVVAAFNLGGVSIVGNHIGQSALAWYTSGGSGTQIAGNFIGGELWCAGNSPAPLGGALPNNVTGARIGQCA